MLVSFSRLYPGGRVPTFKIAPVRGHLAAGARFGARRRAGATEEVRFGVRGALGGAQTPENSGNPPKPHARGLRVDWGGSPRRKVAARGQEAKSMRRSSHQVLDGRYRR